MLEEILIPICICCVLPIMIVWLVMRAKQNEANRKAEIMLKAIEAGVPVDMEQFKARKKTPGTIKQDLLDKLTGACITTFMGVAFIAYSTIGSFCPAWIDGKWLISLSPIAGGILLAVGIALFITYFVGKKTLAREIETEEKKLGQE